MRQHSEARELLVLGLGVFVAMVIGGWFVMSLLTDPGSIPPGWNSLRIADPIRATLLAIGAALLLLGALIGLLGPSTDDTALHALRRHVEQIQAGQNPDPTLPAPAGDDETARLTRAVAELGAAVGRDRAALEDLAAQIRQVADEGSVAIAPSGLQPPTSRIRALGSAPGPLALLAPLGPAGVALTAVRDAVVAQGERAAATRRELVACRQQLETAQHDIQRISLDFDALRGEAERWHSEARTTREALSASGVGDLEREVTAAVAVNGRLHQQVATVLPQVLTTESRLATADQTLAALAPEVERIEQRNLALHTAIEAPQSCCRQIDGLHTQIHDRTKTLADQAHHLQERIKLVVRTGEVLDDLMAQANLLGLNAALEASKAGIKGKGFAIVAHEIRQLAERTATATRPLATLAQELLAIGQAAQQQQYDLVDLTREQGTQVIALKTAFTTLTEQAGGLLAGLKSLAGSLETQRQLAQSRLAEPWQLAGRLGTWQADLEASERHLTAAAAIVTRMGQVAAPSPEQGV